MALSHPSLVLIFIATVAVVANAAGTHTVTLYRDGNFGGESLVLTPVNGTNACYNLPNNWRKQPTSLKSENGDGIQAFSAADCGGTSVHFFPPTTWMGDIWNDNMVSFKFVSSITTEAPPATHGDPKNYGVCNTILIIDNYVVRYLNATLTTEQIYKKYTTYFHDIDAYYTNTFNTHLNLSYIYVETTTSFSNATDGGQLLNEFGTALDNKQFGADMPTDGCVYHLITGKQPPGAAGLAWVGTACRRATGWAVDAKGTDGAGIVLRRAIHEIGHNFNGNHPDAYTNANPPYNCSVNNDIGVYRILRDNNSPVPYTYLEEGSRISDCATAAMTRAMTGYQCLYTNNRYTGPSVSFFQNNNYGGQEFVMPNRRGNDACYNLMTFAGQATSIKATKEIIGIVAYKDGDCRGETTNFTVPKDYVGNDWNDRISSFQFIFNASLVQSTTTTTTGTPAGTTGNAQEGSSTSTTGEYVGSFAVSAYSQSMVALTVLIALWQIVF